MKLLKCNCCGGSLKLINSIHSLYQCEYCGSQYKDENDNIIRIESFTNPVKIYKSNIVLDRYTQMALGPEESSKLAIKQLSENLAEAIAENMELYNEYDPRFMVNRISARVRIVEPKYMF